jgi:hypothetical protein
MPLPEKQCPKCKQMLPVEMFAKNRSKKDGLQYWCRSCKSKQSSNYYVNGGKEKVRSYNKLNPVKVITAQLVRDARERARDKCLPFDIDLYYIRSMVGNNAELSSHCPVFGIPLEWSCQRNQGRGPHPYAPSIDRIDPERGYVKGNVWIISYRANTIKSNATHEELKLVTKAVGKAIVDSLEF